MRRFLNDIRYAMRVLARTPGLSLAVILTLAFGIGVNIALYSFVYTVLLKPLPFRDSPRIAMIWTSMAELGFPKLLSSPADYADVVKNQKSFESISLFKNDFFDLTGSSQPERVMGARVSASLFPMLGVEPLAGRFFSSSEDQPGQHVAIISYGLWQRRFGGDRGIVNKQVFLDREPYTIVGVMPRSFVFPISGPEGNSDPAEIWVPVALSPQQINSRGAMYEYSALGRLASGATLAQAQSELKLIGEQIRKMYPPSVLAALHNTSISFVPVAYHDEVAGKIRMNLLVLLGAVLLLLLITCANIASLLLVRGAARQHEMAIRASLGAGWWQNARLLIAEGTLLAFIGGILGAALALWCRGVLVSMLPSTFPQTGAVEMNGPVLVFAFLICMAASLVFGLVSAAAMFRFPLQQRLQESGRLPAGSRARRRLQSVLVVSQCAIALTLLIGAGLLLRSFSRLLATDPGFQPRQVLRMSLYLPREIYPRPQQIRNFYQQILERTTAVPAVLVAGLSTDLPLDAQETELVHDVDGYRGKPDALPSVRRSWIMGDYLKALNIPLIAGREFTPADNAQSIPVALISKGLAQRVWPGESAIGKRLRAGPSSDLTVVGIVGDVKDGGLGDETQPHIYTPYLQESDDMIGHPTWNALRTINVVAQATVEPSTVARTVEAEIWGLDPQLAITHAEAMSKSIDESVAPQRFNLALLLAIAFLAVFLAVVGIYGVVSYTVSQRTQEIGVRIALGARPRAILSMVLRQGLFLVCIGTILGLAGALALSRFLEALLYGVSSKDALTFSAAPALLIVIALIACYFPARRAMQVEPNTALRYE